MKKNLLWAVSFVFLFAVLQFVLQPVFQPWLMVSWCFSLCLYSTFSVFVSSLFLCKYGRVWAMLCSLAVALPLLNFFYYQNYGAFIPSQLLTALMREPLFLLATLKMQLLPYAGWIILAGSTLAFFSCWCLRPLFKGEKQQPFALFKKWFIWLPALIIWLIQMKWCFKYDLHQVFTRSLYIAGLFGTVSFLAFIVKSKQRSLKILFISGFSLSAFFFALLGGPLKNQVPRLAFDAQFMVEIFDSLFSPERDKSLKQSETASDKYQAFQAPDIPFNVLVIVNDAQRARNMGAYGYDRYPDRPLKSFYQKSYIFQALSPANYTDTAIPALFTGQGPQRHPSAIKDSLTLWDYFPQPFFTFYILTAGKKWARLDEFFNSFNMKYVWSAADDAGQKDALDYIQDETALQQVGQVIKQHPHFVGVFHANSMHFPYYQQEGFTPFQPCETERTHWPQASVNCYDNAIYYLSHLEANLLNEIDLQRTIVVLTSDHGEGFYEHGAYFHNQDLHEESVRVPFIWYIPPALQQQIPATNWNHFVQNQKRYVSTSDLIPTILHLASLLTGQPPAFEREDFTGRSLFEDQTNRIVITSGCFVDYRCFSRDVAFADEHYFVLLRPNALDPVEIYPAFDFNQLHPLPAEEADPEKLANIFSNAPHLHPLGGMLQSLLDVEKLKR